MNTLTQCFRPTYYNPLPNQATSSTSNIFVVPLPNPTQRLAALYWTTSGIKHTQNKWDVKTLLNILHKGKEITTIVMSVSTNQCHALLVQVDTLGQHCSCLQDCLTVLINCKFAPTWASSR